MSGVSDLSTLLASLSPVVSPHLYVFLTRPAATYGAGGELEPIASFCEREGLTIVVRKDRADAAGENYEGEYALISLSVHSDLQAVGLTAAIAGSLAGRGISANIVAAFYHDHIFVPSSRAGDAIEVLSQLVAKNQTKPPIT
ncbi:ACT domain protein [Rubripirellula tenax]|uniref:ACT domain protein n=1 Tax=Rubripirellula tenax TaxID=2528015 RepID=A0A5C6FFH9_9BACT|nr:ACT domain-containing protein [Rubripirellula tenax]TWU60566.1 ACT domain protein [Rubripirellula tenax]